jgi:hypothetical protein
MAISCTDPTDRRDICDIAIFVRSLRVNPLVNGPYSPCARDSLVKAPVAFGIVSLGVLAFACSPRPRGSDQPTVRNTKAERPADVTPRIESALAIRVNAARQDVQFDFSVTNAGGARIEMNFPSGQTHDLVVLDTLGREVWRWSNGRMFTQVLQNKVLRTDDSLSFGEQWSDAPRGKYVAVARLASGNYPIEQRTPFVVP